MKPGFIFFGGVGGGCFIFSHKFSNLLICSVLPHLSLQHFPPPPPLPFDFFLSYATTLINTLWCISCSFKGIVTLLSQNLWRGFSVTASSFPPLLSFFLSPMAERTSSPQWQLIEVAHMQLHQFSLHLQNISGEPLQVLLTVLSVIAADSRAHS